MLRGVVMSQDTSTYVKTSSVAISHYGQPLRLSHIVSVISGGTSGQLVIISHVSSVKNSIPIKDNELQKRCKLLSLDCLDRASCDSMAASRLGLNVIHRRRSEWWWLWMRCLHINFWVALMRNPSLLRLLTWVLGRMRGNEELQAPTTQGTCYASTKCTTYNYTECCGIHAGALFISGVCVVVSPFVSCFGRLPNCAIYDDRIRK